MEYEINWHSKKISINNSYYLNAQKLYNWTSKQQSELINMSYECIFYPCGFVNNQPVIKIANDYKIVIPEKEQFIIEGIILTEKNGHSPYIYNEKTNLIFNYRARKNEKVFLSHSSKNDKILRMISDNLKEHFLDVFTDHESLPNGANIDNHIEEQLRSSDIFVLYYSSSAAKSENVKKEWEWWISNKSLLTLKIIKEKKIALPRDLANLLYVSSENNIEKICTELLKEAPNELNKQA